MHFDGHGINDETGRRVATLTEGMKFLDNGQRNPEGERYAKLFAAAPALAEQLSDLLVAMKDLRKELRATMRFDVKKHYSLMVADVQADKASMRAEAALESLPGKSSPKTA